MSAPRDKDGDAAAKLSAVHVCQNCGAGTRRCDVPLESVINGLVRCDTCGYEGPLNIEIRSEGDFGSTEDGSRLRPSGAACPDSEERAS
jgi:predicted RNA-binding Zn-ribbon protein involved in translation (DUF1610 family)